MHRQADAAFTCMQVFHARVVVPEHVIARGVVEGDAVAEEARPDALPDEVHVQDRGEHLLAVQRRRNGHSVAHQTVPARVRAPGTR